MSAPTKSGAARTPTIAWIGDSAGHMELLDQRALPGKMEILRLSTVEGVREAIRTLAVRGAPAIGCAAAYAMVIAARKAGTAAKLREAAEHLKSSRPTAVMGVLTNHRRRNEGAVKDGVWANFVGGTPSFPLPR